LICREVFNPELLKHIYLIFSTEEIVSVLDLYLFVGKRAYFETKMPDSDDLDSEVCVKYRKLSDLSNFQV
jgi:hypothetical protein